MLKPALIAILPGLALFPAWAGHRPQDDGNFPSAARASIVRFSGEVSRGLSFESKLWPDLAFVLKATDTGWEISVSDGTDRDTDFVGVVTPPYRFDNPRYLGTVYGHSAADALAWTPRGFSFVMDRADHARADDAVHTLLWPSGLPEREIRAAERTLTQVPNRSCRRKSPTTARPRGKPIAATTIFRETARRASRRFRPTGTGPFPSWYGPARSGTTRRCGCKASTMAKPGHSRSNSDDDNRSG